MNKQQIETYWSCYRKKVFIKKQEAHDFARMARSSGVMIFTYHCPICGYYHNGHRNKK